MLNNLDYLSHVTQLWLPYNTRQYPSNQNLLDVLGFRTFSP